MIKISTFMCLLYVFYRFQAQKRKQEAQREERRRQEILSKRREEQKNATEKYQRSHMPPGSRNNSGRSSPRKGSPRRQYVPGLDDALKLIRKNNFHDRPPSGREYSTIANFSNENEDPLKRSYFAHHSSQGVTRPSSGRPNQHRYEAEAQLMDYSLKNLTSSKSLFEQQLEQQQSLHLEQQQKSLKEFNEAVQMELDSAKLGHEKDDRVDPDENEMRMSDSCSSLDSLEKLYDNNENQQSELLNNQGQNMQTLHNPQNQNSMSNHNDNQSQFYLNPNAAQNQTATNQISALQDQNRIPLNIDLTPSATFHRMPVSSAPFQTNNISDSNQSNIENSHAHAHLSESSSNKNQQAQYPRAPPFQMALKQISSDSLAESESSDSSISVVRIPSEKTGQNINPVQATAFLNQGIVIGSQMKINNAPSQAQNSQVNSQPQGDRKGIANVSPSHQSAWASNNNNTNALSGSPLNSANRIKTDVAVDSYNPRYASAIGLSIWPGHAQSNSTSTIGSNVSEATPTTAPISNASSSAYAQNMKNNINVGINNLKDSPAGSRGPSTGSVGPMPSTATISQVSQVASPTVDKRMLHNQADSGILQCPSSSPSQSPSLTSVNNADNFGFNDINNRNGNLSSVLNQQDLSYPLPSHASSLGKISPNHGYANYNFTPSQPSTLSNLQAEISQMSERMVQFSNLGGNNSSSQLSQHGQNSPLSNLHMEKNEHHQSLSHSIVQAVPVPAVRTIFQVSRPPVPVVTKLSLNTTNDALKKGATATATNPDGAITTGLYKGLKQDGMEGKENDSVISETMGLAQDKESENQIDSDADASRPLKGILKQLPPKVVPTGQTGGKIQARDSVELARLHNDKKVSQNLDRLEMFGNFNSLL